MQLADLFPESRILLSLSVADRQGLLDALAAHAAGLGLVDGRSCLEALRAREDLGSTGLGRGIALPHARIEGLTQPVGILATLSRPLDFDASDHEPIDVVFMLLMPAQAGGEQIKILSRVARIARQPDLIDDLRRATSSADALKLLRAAEDDQQDY